MDEIEFFKVQGAGNDFVVVLSDEDRDWKALALSMCDRRFGIGCDGVVLLSGVDVKGASATMRIINSDGSEPETVS